MHSFNRCFLSEQTDLDTAPQTGIEGVVEAVSVDAVLILVATTVVMAGDMRHVAEEVTGRRYKSSDFFFVGQTKII